ncbi:MAG: acetylornithine transaminase [Leuconostoc mesenteroides]
MKNIFPTYQQFPMEIVSGHDCHLVDDGGHEYLDFTSGISVCTLGYNNKKIKEAVKKQLDLIWHTTNLYPSAIQDRVAKLLCPENMIAFFCNSGTEANESALKLARKYTGKQKILAFKNGFHGRTFGSMSVTGNDHIREGFFPLLPETYLADYGDFDVIDSIDNSFAAVILEVIQGEGGINVANREWLQNLTDTCKKNHVLLIIDEIQTGLGRTGTKFAFEQFNIFPDIITCAKSLGNGLPIGAMLGHKSLAKAFGPGSHGTTFGGNKVSLAAAEQVLKQLTPELLMSIQTKGRRVFEYLDSEIATLENVSRVSGLGLMIGIQLNSSINVSDVIAQLQHKGLLTLSAEHNTLRLLPPLVMSDEELLNGLKLIRQVLAA